MSTAKQQIRLLPGRSYLYSGSVDGLTTTVAGFEAIDRLIVDGLTLDVGETRRLVARSTLGAFGQARLVIINNADQLSEIVQNTLLKLLEEPPKSVVIVVQTPSPGRLLPTVLSRLHFFGRDSDSSAVTQSRLAKSPAALLAELIELPRERVREIIVDEMGCLLRQILVTPDEITAERVKLIDRTLKKLDSNANLKLTLDWLLLRWNDF